MGLGEAAEGGATVMAMMMVGAFGLALVVLALVLRWMTGGWRAPAVLVACSVVLAASVFGSSYMSADSRERRRAADLRRDVGAALQLDIGAGALFEDIDSEECPDRDGRGWFASGVAYPLGRTAPTTLPDETLEDLTGRMERGLAGMGLATNRGVDLSRRLPGRWLTGRRGRTSVLVTLNDDGAVFVNAESSCVPDLAPPRPRRALP